MNNRPDATLTIRNCIIRELAIFHKMGGKTGADLRAQANKFRAAGDKRHASILKQAAQRIERGLV